MFSSNDSLWAAKIAAGGGVAITDKSGVLGKHPMALYFDFIKMAAMEDESMKEARVLVNLMKDIPLQADHIEELMNAN